jgi:uncharacterized protein YukE
VACGKPGGDPEAISVAASAIVRYAAGIDDIFMAIDRTGLGAGSATVNLSAFWRGESATSSSEVMSEYQVQLVEYSSQLRDYAMSLREYAQKLSEAQQCTIWEILIWVFIVVFTIIEIACGFFFGGIIEGMFTALFGAIAEGVVDVVSTVGALIGDVVEFAAPFSRIAANLIEAGTEAGETFGDLGAVGIEEGAASGLETLGGAGARAGWQLGADAGFDAGFDAGVDAGSDALTSSIADGGLNAGTNAAESLSDVSLSALRAELSDLGTQVTTKLVSFLESAPQTFVDQSSSFIYKAIYNTAEWYFQELVIRGISSLDPNSGGFAAQWNADDEKAEVLSIMAGMAVGSVGFYLTKNFLSAINSGLTHLGLDISEQLDSLIRAISPSKMNAEAAKNWLTVFGKNVDDAALDAGSLERSAQSTISETELASIRTSGKLDDLGAIIKHETGTEVATDMLDDVMENIWDYGSILALYPAVRGESFDWKELWWYVVYGIVEALMHPPVKHLAGSVTKDYVGDIFPEGAGSLEKDHLVLSESAKNLGDFLIADGLSMLRKVTLDPTQDIGSFSEYLSGHLELEDAGLSTPTGEPLP